MFEHSVGVFTDEVADVLTQATPLGLVLRVLVLPELVAGFFAVDHVLATEFAQHVGLIGRRNDSNRGATGVQDVLHGVRTNATGCAPDQDLLALGHWCAVT